MLDDARARGLEVTFDLTIFPRGGGAWVQSLPGWARDGGNAGDGGDHPRPGLPGPAHRGAVRARPDFWMERLGRPGHLQGQPPGERAPQRPDDRRDRARARPGADRHRARPRPRGRPVLDRPDDQGPGPPRPPDREPAVRADRRRVRATIPRCTGPTGSCPRASGRSRCVLGSYVRDRGVLSLEEAVHKITAEPARRLGLDGSRACSRRGWPPTSSCSIRRRSATGRPRPTRRRDRPASTRVMVNGAWAVIGGRATGERAGLSL